MKKFFISSIFIFISSILFLGCDNILSKNISQQNLNKSEKKDSDFKTKPSNQSEKKDSDFKTKPSNQQFNISNLLVNIKYLGKKGMILNSNFVIGTSIDQVISKLGIPTNKNYVSKAKGTYFSFDKYNIAFGCNKGDQIFEIRSFDKNLNKLDLNLIKRFFGSPDYKITTKEKEIIYGYKLNDTYKILFVFDISNFKLKHYSVLNTNLTKNLMSEDYGRKW